MELPWPELVINLTDVMTLDALRAARKKGVPVDPLTIEMMVRPYVERQVAKFAHVLGDREPTPQHVTALAKLLMGKPRRRHISKRKLPQKVAL